MSVTYRYQSWSSMTTGNDPIDPITVVNSRVKTGGSWQVADVGSYRLWWPWEGPVVRDLGAVRLYVMPDGEPLEGRSPRSRNVRSGAVRATVRGRYGIWAEAAMDEPLVVEALREWEAVNSLAGGHTR